MKVPLNWARPDGRKIRLAVIRHRATKPNRRIGSLFFNPGGPGNSGKDVVKVIGKLLDTYGRGRFDVVSWDIRGSAGDSTSVKCFKNQRSRAKFWGKGTIPTTNTQSRAYRRKTAAFARRCGKRSSPLMRHISAADQSRDLDYLRRLVGDRKLNYYGVSYGTFLGQTYANMFPRRVRSMIIDGVIDPVPYSHGSAAAVASNVLDSDLVLRKFASVCESAGQERCALAGDAPVMPRIEQLLARLTTPAPGAKPPGRLTHGDVLTAIFSDLGHAGAWPQMAQELKEAIEGNGSKLATSARESYSVFRASANGDGFSALWCADSPARQGSGAWSTVIPRLARVSATRGPFLGWYAWGPCASWPTKSAAPYTGPWNKSTKRPILVMGVSNDPNTPFANARRVSHQLGNAVLLKQEGYGHGTYTDPSDCATRAMGRYLTRLNPPEHQVCRSNRVPFDPRFGELPP